MRLRLRPTDPPPTTPPSVWIKSMVLLDENEEIVAKASILKRVREGDVVSMHFVVEKVEP